MPELSSEVVPSGILAELPQRKVEMSFKVLASEGSVWWE